MRLSARNQIPARITAIHSGEAIANIELDASGVRLVASITVEAVQQLGLAVGNEVTAVIKASDVIVGIEDLEAGFAGWPGPFVTTYAALSPVPAGRGGFCPGLRQRDG